MKRSKFIKPGKLRSKRWIVAQEDVFSCLKTTKVIGDIDFDTCEIVRGDKITTIADEGTHIQGVLCSVNSDEESVDAIRMVRIPKMVLSKNFERCDLEEKTIHHQW